MMTLEPRQRHACFRRPDQGGGDAGSVGCPCQPTSRQWPAMRPHLPPTPPHPAQVLGPAKVALENKSLDVRQRESYLKAWGVKKVRWWGGGLTWLGCRRQGAGWVRGW